MMDSVDECDSELLADVKDSLRRQVTATQIVEVEKLIEAARATTRAVELDLRKQREQRVAQMIIRVLRLGKVAELRKEWLRENREAWGREVATLTRAVEVSGRQEFEKRTEENRRERVREVQKALEILPLEPVVIRSLRIGTGQRANVSITEEEETTGANPDPTPSPLFPETTLTDRHLPDVLSHDIRAMLSPTPMAPSLSTQVQSLTNTLTSHLRANKPQCNTAHARSKSSSIQTKPETERMEEPDSRFLSALDVEIAAASSQSVDLKDSSGEEERNRLAILNSSVLRDRFDDSLPVNKSVEVREIDIGTEDHPTSPRDRGVRATRSWKSMVCPCWRRADS